MQTFTSTFPLMLILSVEVRTLIGKAGRAALLDRDPCVNVAELCYVCLGNLAQSWAPRRCNCIHTCSMDH